MTEPEEETETEDLPAKGGTASHLCVEISFLPPADVWSTNKDRNLHWAQRAKLVKAWRHGSHVECSAAKLGELPPSLVTIHIPFARNGRRDPMNYVGTVVKALIDGMVDAGCWPDDTAEFVEIRQPVLVVGGDGLVRVVITPLQNG